MAKELSVKEKAKAYDEAIERAKNFIENGDERERTIAESIFAGIMEESEDERIRKDIVFYIAAHHKDDGEKARWLYWLEKQGSQILANSAKTCKDEQKPIMIQWQGNNLKEVIDFTGKDKNFEKWFKSFEEYEKYVDDHNGIFKLFNADGSHYEVPIGSWIVKTPDGYNVASKAFFRQNSARSEEDSDMVDDIVKSLKKYQLKMPNYRVELQIRWLKLLKDRVLPQPKQEWSEEDEKIKESIITGLEMLKDGASDKSLIALYNKKIDWLKSLKDRYTWKPSDDQMNALAEALSLAKNCGEEGAFDLRTLYEDLKKLMEE